MTVCNDCVIGRLQLTNYILRKEKEISKKEGLNTLHELGATCVSCTRNEVKGAKRRLCSKVVPTFQSLDMFYPVDSVD